MARLEDRLGCFGYFGFGTGYAMAHQGEGYCNTCPKAARCWAAMKARTAGILPAAVQAFEDLLDQGKEGAELVRAWHELTKGDDPNAKPVLDPYSAVMVANIEAGAQAHVTGRWTATRGRFSPPCPLIPVSEATS